jgi:hypothetical protein
VTQQKLNSSNTAGYIIYTTNKRGKLLREFQRLLVPLRPNNKQIRRDTKVNGNRLKTKS